MDYSQVQRLLEQQFPGRYRYIVNSQNNGKTYYWKTINTGYNLMAGEYFDYFIELQDDVRLVKGFFNRVIQAFNAIQDKNKTCMNILVDYSRFMKPIWTNVIPQLYTVNGVELIKTGWVDMFFIANKLFFQTINYSINPIDTSWSSREGVSSGVGMQISRRIISQNKSIYSLKRSAVIHDHHSSVMHPDHRKSVPLITNHDMSKITASMATFPGREVSLQETITSIIDQVDELRIYANNLHKKQLKLHLVQMYLHHKKIKWYFSNDHLGDLGDAGKFYRVEEITGYHFTIDDDIIYPPDYTAIMINAIETYGRRCIISTHGRILPPGKIVSYYKNHSQQFSCLRSVPQDIQAHIIGTGVLAYHTDTIRIPFSIFKAANMADIWFSKYCNDKKIPRIIIKHPGGWIRESHNVDNLTTIYAHNVNDCSFQTEVCNSVEWKLY